MTVVAIPKPETLVSRRALPVLVGVLFFLSGFSALSSDSTASTSVSSCAPKCRSERWTRRAMAGERH